MLILKELFDQISKMRIPFTKCHQPCRPLFRRQLKGFVDIRIQDAPLFGIQGGHTPLTLVGLFSVCDRDKREPSPLTLHGAFRNAIHSSDLEERKSAEKLHIDNLRQGTIYRSEFVEGLTDTGEFVIVSDSLSDVGGESCDFEAAPSLDRH